MCPPGECASQSLQPDTGQTGQQGHCGPGAGLQAHQDSLHAEVRLCQPRNHTFDCITATASGGSQGEQSEGAM